MTRRRVPLFATAVVLAAVAVMIGLGVWQLQRMHWKESLLTRYQSAASVSADAPWPRDADAAEAVLYRHARVSCREVRGMTAMAGRNAGGDVGQAHVARCVLAGGGEADVVLGWSRDPAPVDWQGGDVGGVIAPGPRLVADPPLAGLAANGRPDPSDIPNNHWAYAVQWFLFAVTALIIYGVALWKRARN
ncbi:MAG: SURF1 family protein [Novosphingobium sp.]|nr:SURF1 family protein [Novosphingobium sp.]